MAAIDISTRLARSRSDAVTTMIKAALTLGIEFVPAGADLELRNTEQLSEKDALLLRSNLAALRERLLADADTDAGEALLDQLEVELEEIVDADQARAVVAALPPAVAIDLETEARPEHRVRRPPLRITAQGRIGAHQPQLKDRIPLDPLRAQIRIISIYDPRARKAWLADLRYVPLDALAGLWQRKLLIHNAAFDLGMLEAVGIGPETVVCTQMLAGLVYGCIRGTKAKPGPRALPTVARRALGVDLSKAEQTSDWGAPYLSAAQKIYAGLDAAVCYQAGRIMYQALDRRSRPALELQSTSARATARMRFKGIPSTAGVHRATITAWQNEQEQRRSEFLTATGIEPPAHPAALADWLEGVLPTAVKDGIDRTKTGRLSTTAEILEKLAYRPEIHPYLRWRWTGHRLSTFGEPLLAMIHPVTGRIHGDFIHCATKAGRLTCRDPNVQQLPDDCRRAIEAPEGMLIVWVDWDQIELRLLAELSGCQALRAVYAAEQDVHRITGALMAGVPETEITGAARQAAKPINYGITYGAGPARLAASAFKEYGIEMTVEAARAAKNAFLRRFPGVAAYQRAMSQEPVVWSISGRPLRPEWEAAGEVSYTQRLNFGVQASAADILLTAMIEVDRALPNRMILSLHDEIVLEVPEDQAEAAATTLADCMTAAVLKWFPDAPAGKLVTPKIDKVWS